MNNVLPDLIDTDSVKGLDDNSQLNAFRPDFSIQRCYRNGLGYPVILVDRDNIEYLIYPPNGAGSITHELVIIETISFSSNSVNINTNSVLNVIEYSRKAKVMYDSLEKITTRRMRQVQYHDKTIIIIEYSLTADTFTRKRHAVYLGELDVTVCKQGYDYQVVHPYSPIGQSLIIQNGHNENGFNYVVLINDPEGVFGPRYINIANRIFRVKTTKDRSTKPGVYIYTKGGQVDLNDYSEKDLVEEYTFAEADEKVPLFKTATLAKDFGDAQLSRQEEIRSQETEVKRKEAEVRIKEAELKKMKAELELEKAMLDGKLKTQEAQFKKEQLEQQMRMKNLEDELDRAKMARERMQQEFKHQADMNNINRKDTHELLKIIPAIATAILGVVTLILQIKAKA